MPYPSAKSFGPSTVVQAGDTILVFDAGRGLMTRLWQMGLTRSDVNAVFLTHLHSDHTVGLADVYLTGWLLDAAMKQESTPFVVYGPGPVTDKGRIGTAESIQRLKDAYQADINIRSQLPANGTAIEAHDIPVKGGVIYDQKGVKVTSFPVHHGEANPAFGYRVDYDGRSVLISGDTNYSPGEPLVQAAKNVDVLIHEVMAAPRTYLDTPKGRGIMSLHSTPQQVGEIFAKVKPALGVYHHIVLLPANSSDRATISDVIDTTRKVYKGPLLIAEDLTTIIIEKKGQVSIYKPIKTLLPAAPAFKTGKYGPDLPTQ